jgi:RimJ/RimL family protein N-acetyltransferase
MNGPVIQGKLCRLRPPRPEDAEVMATWFEDLDTSQFLGLRNPPSIGMEKEWLENTAKDPNSVVWVIEVEGRGVGTTGIRDIDWKNGFGTTGTLIGDRSVWRKGNVASGRAQAAAGYREIGRFRADRYVDGRWVDEILTEVLREEWLKQNSV